MAKGNFVAYYRVSTAKQGESGLGLEAQQKAVRDYLDGGRWSIVAEFTEIESGSKSDRPELAKAFAACRARRATLVISKLDRLSRDAHFLLGLQKAGVKFVAADMPEANEMVVGIMALVAQAERRMISERTKAALQAAKARGIKLGNPTRRPPKATPETRAKGSAANAEQARAFAERLRPLLTELDGLSLRTVARELERRGIATARGGKWTAGLVSAARKRLASL